MDNLMNTKLVSGSSPPGQGHSNPVANYTVAPGFGSALQLANSGTHGSLVTLDSYGNIGHHRAHSVIRLPHPDYTAVDMPIFPSINAILQGRPEENNRLSKLKYYSNSHQTLNFFSWLMIQSIKMQTLSLCQQRRIRMMMMIREVKEDPDPCLHTAPCSSCPLPTRERSIKHILNKTL